MTPEYASPEQLCGDRVSTATDVFSLGVVLVECLTGERPRGAKRPSLQGDLENIAAKALAIDPQLRYGTVENSPTICAAFSKGVPFWPVLPPSPIESVALFAGDLAAAVRQT